jgi:hypothetical protein
MKDLGYQINYDTHIGICRNTPQIINENSIDQDAIEQEGIVEIHAAAGYFLDEHVRIIEEKRTVIDDQRE